MGDSDDDHAYGTATLDAPVTRADFERALRGINASTLIMRDQLLQLAAQVVTLTDELTRRIDKVEPKPAPPDTPANVSGMTLETTVELLTPSAIDAVRARDARNDHVMSIDMTGDKYEVDQEGPPCAELIHLCHAKCCTLRFALSTQDLDEGIVRWDYGKPYLIRQRASDGFCVHNDPTTHGCTVHAARPRVCRIYHCKDDARIWKDYENRIPATEPPKEGKPIKFDLMERARARTAALADECVSIEKGFADKEPKRGPKL